MKWACMTANYVAREVNYSATDLSDWGFCHKATVSAFHGPQFEKKFEELIDQIKGIGFDAIELWVAHLDPLQATPEMIRTANHILDKYEMSVISYTAGFSQPGVSREDGIKIFETAQALGVPVLAQGFHPANGELVQELAQTYHIRVGLENHPEKTPQEVMDKIAPFTPWVGSAIDTGWFATQGYDPVRAIQELKKYIVHVHLKDIKAEGGHDSCTLGEGVVDAKEVLATLRKMGYEKPITIELEAMDHDPTDEIKESLNRVQSWWG